MNCSGLQELTTSIGMRWGYCDNTMADTPSRP